MRTWDHMQLAKPRIAGLFLMPLRWIVAWVFFSAAWRRLVLKPEALDPTSSLYEGIKLVHFLPQTAWIKSILHYIIVHPTLMKVFLWGFTSLELTVGMMLFIGLGTRLWGVVSIGLFSMLMLVTGALGSTCLDEWTVASMGIGFGACLLLAGSGPYSIDALIFKRFSHLVGHPIWSILVSPEIYFNDHYDIAKRYALAFSCITFAFVLITNQYFVGGVYGPFYNPAIHMNVEMHAELASNGTLNLTLHRNQGPDTYGDFIIGVRVKDAQGKTILHYDQSQLSHLSDNQIKNKFMLKVRSNGYALLLPLGSLATIEFKPSDVMMLNAGQYEVAIKDISGEVWQTSAMVSEGAKEMSFDPYRLVQTSK